MSINAECKTHNLCLKVPETDQEYTLLADHIQKIIRHIQEHPQCKFVKVKKSAS